MLIKLTHGQQICHMQGYPGPSMLADPVDQNKNSTDRDHGGEDDGILQRQRVLANEYSQSQVYSRRETPTPGQLTLDFFLRTALITPLIAGNLAPTARTLLPTFSKILLCSLTLSATAVAVPITSSSCNA